MCVKVAGSVANVAPPKVSDEFYAALTTTQEALRDNLFLQEMPGSSAPAPAKPSWPPAPELILD